MILFMIFRKHLKQSQSDTRVEKSQADQEDQRIRMFLELRELRSSGAIRGYHMSFIEERAGSHCRLFFERGG